MDEVLTIEFDGGARGNPGPAGIGVVVRAADGTPLVTLGKFLGRATNNVAEYRALITGLEEARKLGARRLKIRGDSELIVKQMRGEYRVRNADLRELHDRAQALLGHFESADISHNLREKNKLADRLANRAMDRKGDVTDADDLPNHAGPAAPGPVIAAPAPVAGDRYACSRCGSVIELVQPSRLPPPQLRPFVCQCGHRMGLPPSQQVS